MEEHIGILVQRIREGKRISQRQLATLSGLDHTYINKLEKGTPKTITLRIARKLAKGLKVRPEIFLSSEDSEDLFYREDFFGIILKEIKQQYRIGNEKPK